MYINNAKIISEIKINKSGILEWVSFSMLLVIIKELHNNIINGIDDDFLYFVKKDKYKWYATYIEKIIFCMRSNTSMLITRSFI